MAFFTRTGSILLRGGGVAKAPAAAMLGLSAYVPAQGFCSGRRPPTDPGRTFTRRNWDKESLDEEYQHQNGLYEESRRKEREKEEERHQDYLRNMRHKKYEENFAGLKQSIGKLDKAMVEGFRRINDSFVKVDARFGKTDEVIVNKVFEASELAASDLLDLLLLLEILSADLDDLQDAIQQKDSDPFMKMLDAIPKMRSWYLYAIAFDVVVSAGCSFPDVLDILGEAHKAAVEEMKGRVEKYRK